MRPSVNDLYSITTNHYINAGDEGPLHFNFLLNTLIFEVNFISLPDMNLVYAVILYKGHSKDKTSDRSYRTISTCPFLAKSLDTYTRHLNLDEWNSQPESINSIPRPGIFP